MRETPSSELKLQYKTILELALIFSLALHILFMQSFKKFEVKIVQRTAKLRALEVEEIPQTQQEKQAAAPPRPSVPIAVENEDLPDDETIEITDLNLDDDPPPPPPPDDGGIVFVPYDEPPMPVGGFQAIQKRLVYPEIARKAGVEGRVLVWAQVDVDGSVVRTKIVKSLGPNGCDEAAVNAIKVVSWKPAKQRDRPVKVWIAVPVDFRLR